MDNYSIEAKELDIKIKNKNVLVLDVRTIPEFNEGHISQAQNLPIDTLPSTFNSLPENTFIVTVCNKGGGRSEEAARLLRENGWSSAVWLAGGYFRWIEAGYSDSEAGLSS